MLVSLLPALVQSSEQDTVLSSGTGRNGVIRSQRLEKCQNSSSNRAVAITHFTSDESGYLGVLVVAQTELIRF
jgi:hypothetical protein